MVGSRSIENIKRSEVRELAGMGPPVAQNSLQVVRVCSIKMVERSEGHELAGAGPPRAEHGR